MTKEEFKAHLLMIAKERPDCFLDLIINLDDEKRIGADFYVKNKTYYASEFSLKMIFNVWDNERGVDIVFEDLLEPMETKITYHDFSNLYHMSVYFVKEFVRVNKNQIDLGVYFSYIKYSDTKKYDFGRTSTEHSVSINLDKLEVVDNSSLGCLDFCKNRFDYDEESVYIPLKFTNGLFDEIEAAINPYLTQKQKSAFRRHLRNIKSNKHRTAMMSLIPYFYRLMEELRQVSESV